MCMSGREQPGLAGARVQMWLVPIPEHWGTTHAHALAEEATGLANHEWPAVEAP
ncbi:hypothetical protein PI125_g2401 [Phytophthora idaei]|nr:hypothetical protein PI125_g2401 [Phytophthora idaei]